MKRFGDRAYEAAYKEMNQLHSRVCWVPIDPATLSDDERKQVLSSLLFVTEKRDESVKARMCLNGAKQRNWISPDEASSPTATLEGILMMAVIGAKQRRKFCVIDVPNAFITTEYEGELVVMKIVGELVDILESMDPAIYKPFVRHERGKKVLYVKIMKALYGMLKSALLFYQKLRKDLEEYGFKVNPYDPCVANMTINGNQMTVSWHVDDLMVSTVCQKDMHDFIRWMKKKHDDPELGEVKVEHGPKFDHLAMIFNFEEDGVLQLDMVYYIEAMLGEFPFQNELGKKVQTPAAEHLFTVREDCTKLGKEKADVFHKFVAKSLFLTKRARPDILLTVAWLCSRVQQPDEDDWKKLLRMLDYLRLTKSLILRLEADDLKLHVWGVDAAFAVHPNFRSQTGATMSLGKGSVYSASTKQKLNTKSSTEAELVAVDDVSNMMLWTNYFLEAQGLDVNCLLKQDNKSSMLLLKNGKASSSKRTRHINIRYYFLQDRIENGEIKLVHCATDDMVADFFTKPLQGSKFRKFRKIIMNLKD